MISLHLPPQAEVAQAEIPKTLLAQQKAFHASVSKLGKSIDKGLDPSLQVSLRVGAGAIRPLDTDHLFLDKRKLPLQYMEANA